MDTIFNVLQSLEPQDRPLQAPHIVLVSIVQAVCKHVAVRVDSRAGTGIVYNPTDRTNYVYVIWNTYHQEISRWMVFLDSSVQ